MKRLLTLIVATLLAASLTVALSSCDALDGTLAEKSCDHEMVEIAEKEATCEEAGNVQYFTCSVCDKVYLDKEGKTETTLEETVVAKKGHTEVTVAAVAPTCTETGLTAGKQCSVCNKVTVAQTTVAALGHTEVDIGAVVPTCAETGLTAGKQCSVCNKVTVAQTTVAALGHTEEIDAAVAATCTADGLTEGKHCSVCDEVLVAQTAVPALGHTEAEPVRENNVPACTQNGSYDEVVYCSVCDIELTREHMTVEKNGHNYVDGICSACNGKKPSEGLEFTLNKDGKSYLVSKGTCTDTDVVIPSTYNDLPVVRISELAFNWCDSLTSITIPGSVTKIDQNAFYKCTSLTSIIVEENNPIYKSIDGNLYFENPYIQDGKALVQYAIGKTDTSFTIPDSVTEIYSSAFRDCTSLTSVVIPDSVTKINDLAFFSCTGLESVHFGENSRLQKMGTQTFSHCTSLMTITIPDSVTEIGRDAFYNIGYSNNEENWENGVLYIGKNLILAKSDISDATIKDGTLVILRGAFSSCPSLKSILIPDSVVMIYSLAFDGCPNLTSVYYGGTASEWNSIDIRALNGDLNLATRYYYSETKPTSDGNYWYYDENGDIAVW